MAFNELTNGLKILHIFVINLPLIVLTLDELKKGNNKGPA